MATTKPARTRKNNRRPTSRKKVKRYNPSPFWSLRNTIAVCAVLLFAAVGSYLIVASHAATDQSSAQLARELVDDPARGLSYKHDPIDMTGPCKGMIHAAQVNNIPVCAHADPGPEGVDVRERVKDVDHQLAQQVAYDAAHPPLATDAPATDDTSSDPSIANDRLAAGSLGSVSARNWPCSGTGSDGPRIRVIYAYQSGATNRLSTLRSSIVSIAKRTNNVFYNSSAGHRQLRFLTNADCSLAISTTVITGDVNSSTNIENQLISHGFNVAKRKFLVEIDGGSGCGQGEVLQDNQPSAANANNTTDLYAFVWKPCWNYSEPHEIMHTLGGVQVGSPHSTPRNHCYDQHDVMCYADGSGVAMKTVCSNTVNLWRFDCNKDDYFAVSPTGSYLPNHWNTANSQFLFHT